jgi:Ca2+-binding RTX toxin-like protein
MIARWMRLAGALTGLLLLVAATPAQAGTARLERTSDPRAGTTVDLVYEAGAGEGNRVAVSGEGNASGTTALIVRDLAGVQPGPGCVRADPADSTRVRCPVEPGATAESFQATLGDRDDTLTLLATAVALVGNVEAGSGNDRIVSSGTMKGGPGNDSLRGGDIGDLFDEGDAGNGRDRIVGGGGVDHLTYEGRLRSVTVDLAGDRDDGERGERDLVGTTVEAVTGGRGEDRLIGNRRDNALSGLQGADVLIGGRGDDGLYAHDIVRARGRTADRLAGGPGEDNLIGSNGANRLNGGGGRDSFTAGRGDDLLLAEDDRLDEATCGPGFDRARLDGFDFVTNGCERTDRPRAAGAVPLRTTRFSAGRGEQLAASVGCPGDGPPICRGRVMVFALGRQLADRAFRLRAGNARSLPFDVPGGNRTLQRIRRVRMVVRSNNGAGGMSTTTLIGPIEPQD